MRAGASSPSAAASSTGRAEVPELARDRAVPQGPRAVRPVRDAPRAHQPDAPADRRRLHGRGAAASVGHQLRGGDPRHRHHARAPAAHLPRSCPRWCSPSTATAPGAPPPGARCSRRCPRRARAARCASCSCREGHDPDTLVAEEGREAFEARLADALPLSEYLVRELVRAERTSSHADGRARFAENARPLFTKVPEGVYRELLLERLAEVVGLATGAPARSCGTAGAAPAARPGAAPPPRVRARVAIGAGRGSLVRQAIVRLLQLSGDRRRGEPPPSAQASMPARSRGWRCCASCSTTCKATPAQIPAQVIDRWERPRGGRVAEETTRPRGSHERCPRGRR